MSLTSVIALNAILDLAIVAGLTALVRIPFLLARRPGEIVPLAGETPLGLAA